jgi:hypothetical protein
VPKLYSTLKKSFYHPDAVPGWIAFLDSNFSLNALTIALPRKDLTVISSPCKACLNKNLPKDVCLKTCQLIRNIQTMQLSRSVDHVGTAVDFSEATHFQVIPPLTSAQNLR